VQRQTANAVVSLTKLATALAVLERRSCPSVATVLVADCDGSADFAQNFYDVSFEIAYDINSAGNTEVLNPFVLGRTLDQRQDCRRTNRVRLQ
jgi:hypothetical protein